MPSRKKTESDHLRNCTKRGLAEIKRRERKREQVKKQARLNAPRLYLTKIKTKLETTASRGEDTEHLHLDALLQLDGEWNNLEQEWRPEYRRSFSVALKEYLISEGFTVAPTGSATEGIIHLKVSWP